MTKTTNDGDYIQKKTHVFLALMPPFLVNLLKPFFIPLINFFLHLKPDLDKELEAIDHKLSPRDYIASGMISYFFFGSLIGLLIFTLSYKNERPLHLSILLGIATAFLIMFMFSYLLIKMPSIELKAKAVEIDRTLVFALKEMVLQSESGSAIFETMLIISNSGYGGLSEEFRWAARRINSGLPTTKVLEDMIKRTRSSYFKKAGWQILNSVKTGSDLKSILQPIIDELNSYQKSQIENYARELSLWSLVYMMFSVAIPTIGSTMLVVLSVFANFGISEGFFIGFVCVCFVIQTMLILLVKSRRPNVMF
ncbi:MAG: type II secretion system F family protein [Nanobdellota archaeon]